MNINSASQETNRTEDTYAELLYAETRTDMIVLVDTMGCYK